MHLLLLLVWIAIATTLRLTHLTTKPLWADEFSTLVFSLGNSYRTIPLDQPLSLAALLQPLQPDPAANVGSVVHHLLNESNHPPLFFVLTHLWLKLFAPENGLVSLWAARAFSVLWGVMAVPAVFSFGWLALRSRLIGHIAAAIMAVSPFGIYLAQEARHYTLAIVWILASLACLVVATQHLTTGRKLPLWLCLIWILVNALGIATHYFVMLTLVAEAIALVGFLLLPVRATTASFITQTFRNIGRHPNTGRLSLVAVGTLASVAVWLPVLQSIRGSELTRWLERGDTEPFVGVDQILQLLAGLITMFYLLPIQDVPLPLVIASAVGLLLLVVCTVRLLPQGFSHLLQQPTTKVSTQILGLFVGAAIALSLVLTFGFGMNFASVFRYQFFYFPVAVVLVGAALSYHWQRTITFPGINTLKINGSWLLIGLLLISLLGGITVVSGFAYQKTHRPDQVAAAVDRFSETPALIAIPHKTHGQTGRLMGVAWELQRLNPEQANRTTFLLTHIAQEDVQPAISSLNRTLQQLPRPLHVWLINFRNEADTLSQTVLTKQGCLAEAKPPSTDGYRYQPYACPREK